MDSGFLVASSLLLLTPSGADVEKLLRLPSSPGAVALLVKHSEDPRVPERFLAALRDPKPETRCAAARAIHNRGLTNAREALKAALQSETDAEAAREEIRALALLSEPAGDGDLFGAAARFGGRLDGELLTILARLRGPAAIPLYFERRERLAVSHSDRILFFLVAGRGQKEHLVPLASRTLGARDASGWRAVLHVAREAKTELDRPVLIAALKSDVAEIRKQTAFALASAYAESPPSSPQEMLEAMSPAPEGSEPDLAFSFELLARSLGRPARSEPSWVALLKEGKSTLSEEALLRPEALALLTSEEREAAKEAFLVRFGKLARDVGETEWQARSSRKKEVAEEESFNLRTLSELPRGLVEDLLDMSGCRPGRYRAVGAAEVVFGEDGRPKRVALLPLPVSKACREASEGLFLLAVAPSGDLVEPSRPEMLVAAWNETCPRAIELSPVPAQAPSDTSMSVLPVQGAVQPPHVTKKVEPWFPRSSRKKGTEGVVIVEAVISREGCLREAKILRGTKSELDLEALLAVSQWRYEPARLEGKAVPVFLTVTVTFNLHL